ncbi:hypothetical protein PWG15_35470 (plasmid) [Ensifer adhaerens]|uniref:hypothetical protein n=1 Tax=Ensifer adhaerens TaxID=106592 RepID=UPI0023A9B5DF|nr:hypothetical protein [Ensifer adhaerens]WDZ81636.1 hypothetical protein PWG15_35470 [Ensifer adhaerens]
MSVADLVTQFKVAQCQLSETADEYESAGFRALEERIEQLFQSIERRVPRDAAELRTVAIFYLDLLEDSDGGFNKRLHDCLRQLVDRHIKDAYPNEVGSVRGGRRHVLAEGQTEK